MMPGNKNLIIYKLIAVGSTPAQSIQIKKLISAALRKPFS